jgi:hypothetical protein
MTDYERFWSAFAGEVWKPPSGRSGLAPTWWNWPACALPRLRARRGGATTPERLTCKRPPGNSAATWNTKPTTTCLTCSTRTRTGLRPRRYLAFPLTPAGGGESRQRGTSGESTVSECKWLKEWPERFRPTWRLVVTRPAPADPWIDLEAGAREFATEAELDAFVRSEAFYAWAEECLARLLAQFTPREPGGSRRG